MEKLNQNLCFPQSVSQNHFVSLLLAICAWLLLAKITSYPVDAQANNLIQNGTFEDGTLTPWQQCGGVKVVDRPVGGPPSFSTDNQKALAFTSLETLCPFYFVHTFRFYQTIDIPSDAQTLVVKFWHYVDHVRPEKGGEYPALSLLLTEDPARSDFNAVSVGVVRSDAPGGWNFAAFEVNPQKLVDLRGKRKYLSFDVGVYTFAGRPNYYVDEIEVVTSAAPETKPQTSLPAELQSDGSRPLLAVQYASDARHIVRLNTDGSGLQTLYSTVNFSLTGATAAAWSPDGTKIAVSEHAAQEDPVEFLSDRARVSSMNVMGTNGENRRELFRTFGQPLTPGVPRGCRFPRTDCTKEEINALDVLVYPWQWSPDSSKLLTLRCVNQRWSFGFTDDATCTRVLRNGTNGLEEGELGQASFLGNWGSNNRLLFPGWLSGVDPGIYESDMSTTPLSATLVYSHFSYLLTSDVALLWLPNNRYFLSLRRAQSFWYNAEGALGGWRYAFMRFDRQEIQNPTQLLYLDHIQTINDYEVSPDGAFVIYSATDFDGLTDLWWMRLATGETGRITNSANLYTVNWRKVAEVPTSTPTATPLPGSTPLPTATPNPLLTRALYLPITQR